MQVYKFGAELEFNADRRSPNVYPEYITSVYWENSVICELRMKPVLARNFQNFMRRWLFGIVSLYTQGLEDLKLAMNNFEGKYTKKGESIHLHFSFSEKELYSEDLYYEYSMALFLLPLFSRGGAFRDTIEERANYIDFEDLDYDSKSDFVTINTTASHRHRHTFEIRINESITFIPMIFISFLYGRDKNIITLMNNFIDKNFHKYEKIFNERYIAIFNEEDINEYLQILETIGNNIKREDAKRIFNVYLKYLGNYLKGNILETKIIEELIPIIRSFSRSLYDSILDSIVCIDLS